MAVERIPFMGKDMRKETVKPVVLVYLVGYIQGVPHVLLVRRGENLAAMRNMWSCIAGYLNGDIDLSRQVLVEIAGETSLLESEVGMLEGLGTFADPEEGSGTTWVRHLFSAVLMKRVNSASELGVRLDYEHSEAAWVPILTVLAWLSGLTPEDPVAREILCEEAQTPDFKLNLERAKSVLSKFVQ
jgi:hypothetical protein